MSMLAPRYTILAPWGKVGGKLSDDPAGTVARGPGVAEDWMASLWTYQAWLQGTACGSAVMGAATRLAQ
eukprot:CAMPEP_0197682152 /NCGR_PEP_ID=MMETSP1338-20131121/96058_1 /TAXON_ID=43686 ORGANISM="Pelagodinium beii, Strain RCC1491" /NCGR_SAMPLE_ID=MMETSP1338 /ASSEMBLY_ACC=CAM_ASM_000754 /LENGTH=68 /DNA_ID=CAMNT_0043263581 /DNA_START=234 /DNA_END=438 /DNA_ORIENTATION=-